MTTILLHPTAYRAATDAQLVDLVRSGDDRAFAAIHERYEGRLHAYARQLLGGAHHDAEEVVQDAFVRALNALRADDREMALKAWLYTIIRNRALDVLRRPVRTTDLEPHAPTLCDAAADPCERFVRSEEISALVAGLKGLPERQRTALVLHEMGGASHQAIAQRLAVTTGGSKALVSRARSGLAKARAAAA
jgi:RNA polymerase sigma-70 factor, ECF subfamily